MDALPPSSAFNLTRYTIMPTTPSKVAAASAPSPSPTVDLSLSYRNVEPTSTPDATPDLQGVTFKQRSDPTRTPFNVITPAGIAINFDREGYYTSACDEVTEYLRTEWKDYCDELEFRVEPMLVEHVKV
jgi:hypothetical protein